MSGSRHEWLDDETAERLLNGEPADSGHRRAAHPASPGVSTDGTPGSTGPTRGVFPGRAAAPDAPPRRVDAAAERAVAAGSCLSAEAADERYEALAGLLRAAAAPAVDPGREDAALAAFRAARTRSGAEGTACDTPEIALPDSPQRGRRLRAIDGGRRSRAPRSVRSTRVMLGSVAVATLLATGVAAAAVGVIPTPFANDFYGPAPHDSVHHGRPESPSEDPQLPEPAGSVSATPTGPHGAARRFGASGGPGPSATPAGPYGDQRFVTGPDVPCQALPTPSATPGAAPSGDPAAPCEGPTPPGAPTAPLLPVQTPITPGDVLPSPGACCPTAPPAPSDTPSPVALPPATASPAPAPSSTSIPSPLITTGPSSSASPPPCAAAPTPAPSSSPAPATPSPDPTGCAAPDPATATAAD